MVVRFSSKERGLLAIAIAWSSAACSQWERPIPAEKGTQGADEAVGVTSEALGTSLKGVYVVANTPLTATCDDGLPLAHGDALQACIDKANADGGGTVLVGAGVYNNGAWPLNLKSNVTLTGQGHLGAKLAPANVNQIIGNVGDNTVIADLTFDQSGITPTFPNGAIAFSSIGPHSNIRIENNLFTANSIASSYGIVSFVAGNSFQRITIRGNVFQYSGVASNSVFSSIYFGAGSGTGSMDFVRIENNDISVAAAGGAANQVQISLFQSPFAPAPSRGIVINGNSIRSTGPQGINVGGAFDAQISGNSVETNTEPSAYTIRVRQVGSLSCGATVTGNRVRGSKILVEPQCSANTVLSGNTDNGSPAGMGKVGVAVRAYRGGNQTFTAGTESVLVYNNEEVDYGANFDPATGLFTAPIAGLYKIRACARINATNFAVGDTADVSLYSGTAAFALQRTVFGGGSTSFTTCAEDAVALASGAVVKATVFASGTANTRTVSGLGKYSSFFTARKISD